MVNRVQIHVSSPKKSMPVKKLMNATLSNPMLQKPFNGDISAVKREPKMFTTKEVKEHHLNLEENMDKTIQHQNVNKRMNKTFYSSNNN